MFFKYTVRFEIIRLSILGVDTVTFFFVIVYIFTRRESIFAMHDLEDGIPVAVTLAPIYCSVIILKPNRLDWAYSIYEVFYT